MFIQVLEPPLLKMFSAKQRACSKSSFFKGVYFSLSLFISATHSSNPYERYDPTKSDHSKLEVQTEEKKKKKKKKKEKDIDSDSDNETTSKKKKKTDKQKEEEIASTAPEVSKERFFKVESSLKSLFTSTSSGGDDQQQVRFV